MPEFFGEEIDAENRERAEYRREEFECRDVCSKEKDGEGLEIDEESFTAVIVGVKKAVFASSVRADRVDTVHCLIRVEPGGNVFDIPEPQEKCRCEEDDQDGCRHEFFIRKKMPEEVSSHKLTFFIFFFRLKKKYDRIIA